MTDVERVAWKRGYRAALGAAAAICKAMDEEQVGGVFRMACIMCEKAIREKMAQDCPPEGGAE